MNKKSILVVDDEEIIVNTLSDDLQCQGYRVDIASDGQQGLDLFKIHRHKLVIADLNMERMGGIEMVRKIKAIDSQTKVIVLTGYGTRESAIDSLRMRVDDFILKPYKRKGLLEKIALLLDDQAENSALQKTNAPWETWGLSEREIEVSKLMLVGRTKEEIASQLFISKLTVDTHVKNIYKKLNVNSLSKFIGKLSAYHH